MPVDIVPASVARRSLAYALDVLVVGVPPTLGVWWLLLVGFSPSPGLGWAGIGSLVLVGLLYALFVASSVSRTGQSLGKKMVGLRVLRTDTGQPSSMSESMVRGLYFVVGLLGLAVLPIMQGIQLARGVKDSESWPHQLVGSQVVDIRRGPDPLNAAETLYPEFPEQWITPAEEAPFSTAFPRPVPAWSAAYVPEVSRPPISRPAQPDASVSAPKKTPAWVAGAVQSVVAAAAVSALSAAMVVSVTALQPGSPPPKDPSVFSAATLAQNKVPLSAYSGAGFPGYGVGPAWKYPVSATALTLANKAGTFIFDNRSLTILNNLDGKVVAKETLKGNVVLTQETKLGDEDGMVWQVGTTLHGWAPSMGGSSAIQATLPHGAKISAAGSSLLIQSADGKPFTFGKTGLVPLTVPQDRLPLAVDNGKFISARFAGPLTLSSFNGKAQSDVPVKAPGANLQIMQWVTAGHGLLVLLWSALPGSTDPNNPVTIAVYREATGELLSQLVVSKSRIEEDPQWVRGGGLEWASFAGYVYDLSIGWPILDLKAQEIKRSGFLGDGVTGESQDGTVYLRRDNSWIFAGMQPLGLAQNGIILRTKDNELQRFGAG